MSRKRCHRRPVPALPPRGLRPLLDRAQVTELGIVHLANLDQVAHGQATEAVLWEIVAGVLTWHRVAQQLQAGLDEMQAQVELVTSMVRRYGRTGRVAFSGLEYQTAKRGIEVMDQLAEIADQPTALEAATWSELRVNRALASPVALEQLQTWLPAAWAWRAAA